MYIYIYIYMYQPFMPKNPYIYIYAKFTNVQLKLDIAQTDIQNNEYN